jgi:hypothetical protein
MPSTAKQAETTAFESVRVDTPFARVYGRPNYYIIKEVACAPASKVKDITYMWIKNPIDSYGLLANILGINKYNNFTSINMKVIPNEPASYDPAISNATPTHMQK